MHLCRRENMTCSLAKKGVLNFREKLLSCRLLLQTYPTVPKNSHILVSITRQAISEWQNELGSIELGGLGQYDKNLCFGMEITSASFVWSAPIDSHTIAGDIRLNQAFPWSSWWRHARGDHFQHVDVGANWFFSVWYVQYLVFYYITHVYDSSSAP